MEPVTTIEGFVGRILRRDHPGDHLMSYRGHGNQSYRLQPSIFRTQQSQQKEHILLRELVAAHPEDFHGDASALELLVRMQHYSLPTRLLDVSLNPLVALFFATEPAKKRVPGLRNGKLTKVTVEADGEVVIFKVPTRRVRYFDSDTVCILANLARLPWELKSAIDTSKPQDDFNKDLPIRRLLHFIRQESFGFEDVIVPRHLDEVLMVKPKQNNRRILAQSGAFFIFGRTTELDRATGDDIEIERIVISARDKATIRQGLDKLGINEKTLFPEIERAARYIAGTLAAPPVLTSLVSK